MPLGSLGFDPRTHQTARSVPTDRQDTDRWILAVIHGNSQALLLLDMGLNYAQWNRLSPTNKMTLAQTAPLPRFDDFGQIFIRIGRAPTLQELVGKLVQPTFRYGLATPVRSDAVAREIVAMLDSYCAGLASLPLPAGGPTVAITAGNIANFARHYPEALLQRMLPSSGHVIVYDSLCRWWASLPKFGQEDCQLLRLRDLSTHGSEYSWSFLSAMTLLDGYCTGAAGLIPAHVRPAGLASAYAASASYFNGPTLLASAVAFAAGYATSRYLRAKRR